MFELREIFLTPAEYMRQSKIKDYDQLEILIQQGLVHQIELNEGRKGKRIVVQRWVCTLNQDKVIKMGVERLGIVLKNIKPSLGLQSDLLKKYIARKSIRLSA